jgi:tetratricopeptide (TPR) repeat protein
MAEYEKHMSGQIVLVQTYERLMTVFRETENDIVQLKNERIRRELAMEETMMAAMVFASTTPAPTPVPFNQRNLLTPQAIANRNYNAARGAFMLELNNGSGQLSQLNSTEQYSVRRRAEAFQDYQQLEMDLAQWNQKWPLFFDRFWQFSDPESKRTAAENEAILAELANASAGHTPALIIKGLVEYRLGQSDQALISLGQAISQNTMLDPIAYAARALVYESRDDGPRARKEMTLAFKAAPQNTYVMWFKAKWAGAQGDFSTAKKLLTRLVDTQQHEVASRHLLAILTAMQPNPLRRDIEAAITHARLASDFTGEEDWFSELVLAMALQVQNKKKESLEKAEHALELAEDTNQERCKKVIEWIENNGPLEWPILPE